MGEEILEFVIELRGKGFVVRHHDRRPIDLLNHLGHGVRLARPGDSQQHLMLLPVGESSHEGLDGRRLVALRLVIAD